MRWFLPSWLRPLPDAARHMPPDKATTATPAPPHASGWPGASCCSPSAPQLSSLFTRAGRECSRESLPVLGYTSSGIVLLVTVGREGVDGCVFPMWRLWVR